MQYTAFSTETPTRAGKFYEATLTNIYKLTFTSIFASGRSTTQEDHKGGHVDTAKL